MHRIDARWRTSRHAHGHAHGQQHGGHAARHVVGTRYDAFLSLAVADCDPPRLELYTVQRGRARHHIAFSVGTRRVQNAQNGGNTYGNKKSYVSAVNDRHIFVFPNRELQFSQRWTPQ